MTLQKYIEGMGDRAAAKLFGVSPNTCQAWRTGRRQPRPQAAINIEKKTFGKVSFEECYR